MTLNDLKNGTSARITAIDWTHIDADDAKRLQALGVDTGAEISIAHRGVFGGSDPLALNIGRMKIALRRAHCAAIAVEPL